MLKVLIRRPQAAPPMTERHARGNDPALGGGVAASGVPRPSLRDGDLLLRPLHAGDAPALWVAGQAEDLGCYTSIAWPFTRDAARRLIAAAAAWAVGTAARFAVILCPDGPAERLIGTVSLLHLYPDRADAEVGYWLAPAARGRGVARRAVALLCAWALGPLGLRRLHLLVDLDNASSHGVARACGFRPVGAVPWAHPTDRSKDALCLAYERLGGDRRERMVHQGVPSAARRSRVPRPLN